MRKGICEEKEGQGVLLRGKGSDQSRHETQETLQSYLLPTSAAVKGSSSTILKLMVNGSGA